MRQSGLARFARAALRRFGMEVRRSRPHGSGGDPMARATLAGALAQAQRVGLTPATVLDVGAAYGTFTAGCYAVFPDARYVMVEPLAEFHPTLERLAASLPRAEVVRAAIAAADGPVALNVHRDLVGSSLYREAEGPAVDGTSREVPALSLDRLTRESALRGPVLLKVDVQGAELDVLACGTETLRMTELVILEVSLFRFFEGGPQLLDIVAAMARHGFVAYDVAGLLYRPLDGALAQLDLVFVREDGSFRRFHHYASPEQRAVQDAAMREGFRAELETGRR